MASRASLSYRNGPASSRPDRQESARVDANFQGLLDLRRQFEPSGQVAAGWSWLL